MGQPFTTDEEVPILDLRFHSPYANTGYSRSNSIQSHTSIRLSQVASPRLTSGDQPEMIRRGRKVASRSGSVNSLQSERGGRPKSRSSPFVYHHRSGSVGANRYSPGFEEHAFGSKKRRATSRTSSTGSGRSGPLDYLVRVGMKAVRAAGGACWRCKILGKKVLFTISRL